MRKLFICLGLLSVGVVWAAAAPTITVVPPDLQIAAGTYNGFVTTFTYVSPPPVPGPWTVSVVWGASGPTSSGTVSGAGPFTITTAPVSLNGGDIPDVFVSVSDPANGGFGNTVGVAHVHQLVPSAPPNIEATEGVEYNEFVCGFVDFASAGPAEFTVSIDWGDGTAPTSGTIEGSGFFSVTGAHTWAVNGSYTVTCTIQHTASGANTTNEGGAEVFSTDEFDVTLTNPVGHWGVPIGVVLTASDPNTSTTAAQLGGGALFTDDNAEEDCVVTGGAGAFTLTCAHRPKGFPGSQIFYCAGLGENSPNGSGNGFCGGLIEMRNGPMAPAPQPIFGRPTVALNAIVAGIVDANPLARESDFATATIDWGDGNSSAGTFARNGTGGYFVVTGTHTYAAAGSFTVTTVATDRFGESVTMTSTANIATTALTGSPRTLVLRQNVASTVDVAGFTIFDLGSEEADFGATIDWGDGSTAAAGTVVGSRGDFVVNGTHTFTKAGIYASTVTITDKRAGGGTATVKSSITVNDSNLTITAPGGITRHVGEEFTFSFTFTDADTAAAAAKYAIDVDWGDATTSTAATVTPSGTGFGASAKHTYGEAGSFDLVVTISNALAAGGPSIIYTFTVKATVLPADTSIPDMATGGGGGGNDGCSCDIGARSPASNWWMLLAPFAVLLLRRRRRA